nr:hypothetical protein [Tanacetum cinerariifolium]
MEAQPEIPQNISSLKLPMLKTRDYDLWTKKNELKAKSTLLLAIPNEHQLKFHSIKDAKSLWEAIKTRFRWNKESKKMHKTILKQQYENFVASRSEGLDKTYDSLKLYEAEVKGQSSSSSNSHNVAFMSSENTSNINEAVNATQDILAARLKEQPSASSYVDDVMFSFFASQSNTPQLDNEDLEQINTDYLEEMDLKWLVAMITMKVKRFIKKTGRNLNFNGKEPVGFDKTRVKCYNCHIRGHFSREWCAPRNQGNRSGDDERRGVPIETPASAWCQISANDKTGLGYDSQLSENERPKCEIFKAASDSEIDEDNNQAKDMYKLRIRYHAIPPPYTRDYMPPKADLSFIGLDESLFKFKISKTRTSVNENESITSKSSEEIREEPKTVRFEQIIDFLNGSSVKYALTVHPNIHTSCIKQFWTTAKVKKVDDEVQIQALVDGKRVNIKESSIRRTLRLDDAEGTSCLTNAEIFKGLARMGTKTTSWNEFSSTMASFIIFVATNQKFNFSRYILLSLVKNKEAGVPFFMFLRVERLEEENKVLKELKSVHSKVDSNEPVMEMEKSSKQESRTGC